MIRRGWRLWTGLGVLLVAGGLALVPSVRWPVYGWLRNEVFYQGMPTSWWSAEFQHWEWGGTVAFDGPGTTIWERRHSELQVWLAQQLGYRLTTGDAITALPPLTGDPAAVPLLIELLNQRNLKVRRMALTGLDRVHRDAADLAIPALEELVRDAKPPPGDDDDKGTWAEYEFYQDVEGVLGSIRYSRKNRER